LPRRVGPHPAACYLSLLKRVCEKLEQMRRGGSGLLSGAVIFHPTQWQLSLQKWKRS